MTKTLTRRGAVSLMADVLEDTYSPRKRTSSTNCEGISVSSGLNPVSGLGREELVHLLKRTLIGITKEDIDHFSGMSLSQVLDELLSVPSAITSYPLRDYQSSGPDGNDWAGIAIGETWVNNPPDQSGPGGVLAIDDNVFRTFSVRRWNMGVAMEGQRSVYEKLVLFWHNHFPVSIETVNRAQRAYVYAKLIRENVNTDLREMCKKITKDPGMLSYLNGEVNTSQAPDENYARELQELFTIGKEIPADKRYTEDDVKAFARALTGHGISFDNWMDAQYYFATFRHAYGDKQLSPFYSNAVIKGGSGQTAGDTELDQIIDILFDDTDNNIAPLQGTEFAGMTRADIIADHLVKKIYRFFVYYEIDDFIQDNIIKPLADTYKNNDFKILPVLRQLFSSEHFYDQVFRGAYIKMPYDAVVGLSRTLHVNHTNPDTLTQYAIYEKYMAETQEMQQGALEPPNIAGWPAYYQSPKFHKIWINADTLPKRQDFAKALVANGHTVFVFSGGNFSFVKVGMDHMEFVKTLSNPGDPNSLIEELSELLLGIPLSEEHKQQVKIDKLLSGQEQDYYWTDAWATAVNGGNTNTVVSRLRALFDYLVRLEEFQLT